MSESEAPDLAEALDGKPASGDCSPAALLAQLWESLSDILGPATTATLIRRGTKYALVRHPALRGLEVTREGFEYRYRLPAAWSEGSKESMDALRALFRELWRLLVPLTDRVIVRRLERLPDFQRCDLIPPEERQ